MTKDEPIGRVPMPKNRKERRAALKEAKKQTTHRDGAGEVRRDQAVPPAVADALTLQDQIQRVIAGHFREELTAEQVGEVVQCLGYTAAGLSVRIGVGEAEFSESMRLYMQQVRQALGLPVEAPAEDAPLIVAP